VQAARTPTRTARFGISIVPSGHKPGGAICSIRTIHSVDSAALAERLQAIATRDGLSPRRGFCREVALTPANRF